MKVKILNVNGKKYYAFKASYFKNDSEAEKHGYYWDDELGLWTRKITNSTTTIFI